MNKVYIALKNIREKAVNLQTERKVMVRMAGTHAVTADDVLNVS